MRVALLSAAVYNFAWGAAAIFFPLAGFELAGIPIPNYPELWQCIGMIVGVYGVGYAIAATFRGFQTVILKRHGIGRFVGDIFQMPGVFLLFHGEVIRSYRHQSAADRPSYRKIIGEDLLPS
jgi:hypothetical protein